MTVVTPQHMHTHTSMYTHTHIYSGCLQAPARGQLVRLQSGESAKVFLPQLKPGSH